MGESPSREWCCMTEAMTETIGYYEIWLCFSSHLWQRTAPTEHAMRRYMIIWTNSTQLITIWSGRIMTRLLRVSIQQLWPSHRHLSEPQLQKSSLDGCTSNSYKNISEATLNTPSLGGFKCFKKETEGCCIIQYRFYLPSAARARNQNRLASP